MQIDYSLYTCKDTTERGVSDMRSPASLQKQISLCKIYSADQGRGCRRTLPNVEEQTTAVTTAHTCKPPWPLRNRPHTVNDCLISICSGCRQPGEQWHSAARTVHLFRLGCEAWRLAGLQASLHWILVNERPAQPITAHFQSGLPGSTPISPTLHPVSPCAWPQLQSAGTRFWHCFSFWVGVGVTLSTHKPASPFLTLPPFSLPQPHRRHCSSTNHQTNNNLGSLPDSRSHAGFTFWSWPSVPYLITFEQQSERAFALIWVPVTVLVIISSPAAL